MLAPWQITVWLYDRGMKQTESAVDAFHAIADPTRRAMLLRLAREGERSVSQLKKPFAISQPAVSKHLRILRDAGLVRFRKSGRESLYDIDATRLHDVQEWITQIEEYWDQRLDALGKYLDAKKRNKPTSQ